MNTLKRFVAVAIMVVVAWAIISTFLNVQAFVTAYILIALGILLFLVSFLSNIRRSSPIRIGVINRGEFYGVVVVILGAFFYMNTRIDTLFTIISQIR